MSMLRNLRGELLMNKSHSKSSSHFTRLLCSRISDLKTDQHLKIHDQISLHYVSLL